MKSEEEKILLQKMEKYDFGESLMLYLEGIFYHSKDSDLEEFSYGKIPRKIYKKEKIRESF